jgi:hypothetical protein
MVSALSYPAAAAPRFRGIDFSILARNTVTEAPTRHRFASPSVMSNAATSADAAGSAAYQL